MPSSDPPRRLFVIGPPKAGTTALYHTLRVHPEVGMATNKEPHHFAYTESPSYRGPGDEAFRQATVTDREEYEALFPRDTTGLRYLGEASTYYLASPTAPKRIAEAFGPDARIVAILRHPVDRAYSAWSHMRMEGREPLGFLEALQAENERLEQGWSPIFAYRHMGRYSEFVDEWTARFEPHQVRFWSHDRVLHDTEAWLDAFTAWLELTTPLQPPPRVNVSGTPRSRLAHRVLHHRGRLRAAMRPYIPEWARSLVHLAVRANTRQRDQLDPTLRRELTAAFRGDIEAARRVTGERLPDWC